MTNTTAEFGVAAAPELLTTPASSPALRVADAPTRSLRALSGRGVDVSLEVAEPGEYEIILSARIRGRDGRREARGRRLMLKSQADRAQALRGNYQRIDRSVVHVTEPGTVSVKLRPNPLQRIALLGEDGLNAQLDVRRRINGVERHELRRSVRFG